MSPISNDGSLRQRSYALHPRMMEREARAAFRLDCSINTVAEKFDRYENTVQSQSIWAVYRGENRKGQFLDDLLEIENSGLEHQDQR